MGRKKKTVKPLETIWEVPDELWERIEPILLEDAPCLQRRREDESGPTGVKHSTGSSSA
jgi:hypothetical protein